ncbi:MAG: ABC transporter ATP-binding protein [Bacilli bacterium]|nr:ABC transporter ATP-binding protein [Bacilli bacterium]
MRNNKERLPLKYSTSTILKRVFKYALKSTSILAVSIFFLIIFSILEIFQPLIIKKIIDDELSGVQAVWVEVVKNDETIGYNGKFYQKEDGTLTGDKYTLRYFEEIGETGKYIFITGQLAEKDSLIGYEDNKVIVQREDNTQASYEYRILSPNDMLSFYGDSSEKIGYWLMIYAIVAIVILVSRYIQMVSFTSASMKLTLDMRKSAFEKLNRLPISYFSGEPHGKTVTKMIYDSEGVRGLYEVIFSIFSAAISLITVYFGLFALEPKLAWLTFIAFPLLYIWLTVYRKAINKLNQFIREMNSRINGKMAEFTNGVSIIQIFNQEKNMTEEYDDLLTKNYKTKMKHLRINTLFGYDLLILIRRLLVAFVLLYFGLKYFSPGVAVIGTTIYVYVQYIERLVNPISEIFSNLNSLEDSLVSASRIFEFLDEEEDTALGEVTDLKLSGAIEFKNVTFKYEEGKNVLENVSFKTASGQFIGLVGHTGSGKTTLMSLLERYYDLEEGQILVDGVDYLSYSKQDIRNNIGIILQDASIFEGTIKSNIAFGLDVSDEDVEDILLKIGANKFVNVYPKGIHTEVSFMGDNLSTGEKQLIAFARILLRNPSIIILDEATANIDTETEVMIQKSLMVLSENRTTFVVAHRLSTIRSADMIYVLEDGKIVESGNHEQLYHLEKGKYRAMYEAQYNNK